MNITNFCFKKKKFKIKLIRLKIIILLIILIYFFYLLLYNLIIKIKYLKIKEFEKKTKNINNDEIIEFHRINSENILIDKKKYKRSIYPDISIILTMYNQAHCIHKSLRSIQNQSLKNIEIIVIDDCSLDNSTEIVKNYQREDERIILLENDKNEGKIKTRSEGIKIAKGKYITIIDGDDSLAHKDVLNNSITIANLANLDIVEFRILYFENNKYRGIANNYTNNFKDINNKIIYQPELRNKFFIINDIDSFRTIQNRNVCGKIIKTKIYHQIIKYLGVKYTEEYINNYEDTIMAVSLF